VSACKVWDGLWGPIWGSKMFVECSSDGQIVAAYVDQQYPDQKWVPASNEAFQSFLTGAPRLGKDAKGRTCLLPAPSPLPLPKRRHPRDAGAQVKLGRRVCGQASSEVSDSLAMRLTVALYEDAQHEPMPWRWIGDTAERAGIRHRDQCELALEHAEATGLLIIDAGRSVSLTVAGMKAARRLLISGRDAQLGKLAVPVQPSPSTSSVQLEAEI
jgi:hypothetical protein